MLFSAVYSELVLPKHDSALPELFAQKGVVGHVGALVDP